MRFPRMAFLGVSSLLVGAAACGSTVDDSKLSGGTTSGSGGTSTASSTVASGSTASSSSSTGTGGAGGADDNGMPSDVYPAPHADTPQAITYGGPVLTAPKIVPVFFAGDDPALVTQLEDFDSKIGGTQYWAANVTEYGVGAATALPPIELTEMAATTLQDADIQTWLGGKLNSNDTAFPAADANTVYVLHYPASTTITLDGDKSCQTFGGYHSDFKLDAAHGSLLVAYAVVPRCSNFDGMDALQATTSSESHELIEASTDPYPMDNPAYADVDSQHFYWSRILGGGEIGDLCAQFESSFTTFPELAYEVQRSWSNKAAKAGHDPCVPALAGSVYFNTAPLLKDNITTSLGGQSLIEKGAKIAVGATGVVELDLFSEAATSGPWTVTVKDAQAAFGGTALLDLSLDKTTGVNGEKLHLSITVKTAGKHNTENFLVESTLGTQKNLWIGLVGN